MGDMAKDDIPDGLTLEYNGGSAFLFKVKTMSQGPSEDSVYVVFSSTTLPKGWNKPDAPLPPAGKYFGFLCYKDNTTMPVFARDIYRLGTVPDCFPNGGGTEAFSIYDVFYKFDYANGKLKNPKPFFVLENQLSPGHLGGGIATLDSGMLLFSTGDGLPYGSEGRYAPQDDDEALGKILLIDPT